MKFGLSCLLVIIVCNLHAQNINDTIRKIAAKDITRNFPTTRFLDFQYEQFGSSNYTLKNDNTDIQQGKVHVQRRFKAAFNMPIFKKNSWTLSTSIRYKYESFDLQNIHSLDNATPNYDAKTLNFQYVMGALNLSHNDKLLGKYFCLI